MSTRKPMYQAVMSSYGGRESEGGSGRLVVGLLWDPHPHLAVGVDH